MESDRIIRRADPTSIQNKVLVGYQGWFTCAGDGPPVHQGHHGWLHWFDKPLVDGGHPNFDQYPDTSEYLPEELYPVPGLSLPSTQQGQTQPAVLFSSRNPKTVQRHFHWMAMHGIDGVFLQRFATQCEVDGNTTGATADLMRLRDEVLDRVREAAEKENRVWAIMYDVAGLPADRIEHVLRTDWEHLMRDKRVLDSPYYLRERGHPVVAIWGFGFVDSRHDPQMLTSVVRHIKATTPGEAYVWGGVPSQWRTLSGDMDPNPAFLDLFKNEFDALSPWTVGRYHNQETIDRFTEERTRGDLNELKDLPRRVDFFPTIFPGGSGHNMSKWQYPLNDPPREGGKFFWRQLWNVKHLGTRTIYVAMFDEYDEGTAILPTVPLKRSLPKCDNPNHQFPFIALDADGIDNLPPDWYLRVCGFAAEAMKDERRVYEDLPKKELDDYWATRPKYEISQQGYASNSGGRSEALDAGASGSSTSKNNSTLSTDQRQPPIRRETGAWGAFGSDFTEAPPAYSLEASETISAAGAAAPTSLPSVVQEASSVTTSVSFSSNQSPGTPGEAIGVHRSSSYNSAPRPQNGNHGAAGVGRASTYSPPSSAPPNNHSPFIPVSQNSPLSSVGFAPRRYAPPATPPPRTSSPLRPSNALPRPPVRPPSSSSIPSSNSLQGASTPPLPYVPYQRPSAGTAPTSSSGSGLPQDFANSMNLGVAGSGPNSPPTGNTAILGSVGVSPGLSNPMLQPIGGSGSSSSAYSYPMASGYSTGNPSSSVVSSNSLNTSYFGPGSGSSYRPGIPSAADAKATVSGSTWSPPSVPPPMQTDPASLSGASVPSILPVPDIAPSITVPGSANPSVPPQSHYPGGPMPQTQSQAWTSPYPASSLYQANASNSNSNSPFPSPGLGPSTSGPPLPPKPSGEPGGFVALQKDNKFLGSLVHKASGMVDKYAGESTRIQLEKGVEKGVSTVTQTGSKLLGRFTTNK